VQAITYAPRLRALPAVLLPVVVAAAALMMLAGSAAASTARSAAQATPHPIPWTGWNGRPIQHPHKPVDRALLATASYPAAWSAGAVRYGTGYHRPEGSQRVREVQRRLTRLGYHTGPIDGLYGPLTRSAVQWFQIKHGLRPTGVVAATTLAALRDPGGFARDSRVRTKRPARPGRGEPPRPVAVTPAVERQPHGGETPGWLIPVAFAMLVLTLGLVAFTLLLARQKPRRERRPRERRHVAPRPIAAPRRPPPVVVGYVNADTPEAIEPHEHAIKVACEQHGWELGQLIRDNGREGRALTRPGMAYALDQLSSGAASRLMVSRLDHVSRSLGELRAVLAWFRRRGITLNALDVELDTATLEGQTAVRALLSGITPELALPANPSRLEVAERN
jgi:Putative peptidoglycan binding domain/Resolvase, N terminal domain